MNELERLNEIMSVQILTRHTMLTQLMVAMHSSSLFRLRAQHRSFCSGSRGCIEPEESAEQPGTAACRRLGHKLRNFQALSSLPPSLANRRALILRGPRIYSIIFISSEGPGHIILQICHVNYMHSARS